jgi:DNA-binding transcriptional ArsR family regulator
MAVSRTPERVDGSGDDGSLSKDLVFTMLSNARRRHVIHYLKQRGERVTIRELSRQVAAWENGVETDDLDYKQRKRVYTSLHQTHLPKLDDAGIVDYDRDRGTVALGTGASELEVYMEIVPEKELPWSVYYLGLGVISLALVSLVWLDVFPFAGVPDAALAALVAVVFTASAAVQTYYSGDVRLGGTGPPPTAPTPRDAETPADGDGAAAPEDS